MIGVQQIDRVVEVVEETLKGNQEGVNYVRLLSFVSAFSGVFFSSISFSNINGSNKNFNVEF